MALPGFSANLSLPSNATATAAANVSFGGPKPSPTDGAPIVGGLAFTPATVGVLLALSVVGSALILKTAGR